MKTGGFTLHVISDSCFIISITSEVNYLL